MRRIVALTLTSSLALLALAPADAAPKRADRPSPPPWLLVEDGMTKPQFDLADTIEETLWVQTTVDSDLDGRNDRVRVQVSRPAETETEGIKVPVVFEHSPYRSNIGGGTNHNVDFTRMPQEGIQPRRSLASSSATPVSKPDLPGGLDNYWVPRGYAVVLGESIGTGFSDGCSTVGDMKETLGTRAVIDWLNGRAAAYDEDGNPVEADWTTGDVGMTGVSYNGTLPNQVATTGVEGLRTIVPVSAISSWYDYYRANGLVRAPHSNRSGAGENAYLGEDLDVLADFVNGAEPGRQVPPRRRGDAARAQDRVTGDYNAYWDERNYLDRADDVEASVFVVHGLEDYNVMPHASPASGRSSPTPGCHARSGSTTAATADRAPPPATRTRLNRWIGYWLFGVPQRDRRRAARRRPASRRRLRQFADWPVPGARDARLGLGATGAAEPGTSPPGR